MVIYPHILSFVLPTESEIDENGNIITIVPQDTITDNDGDIITIGGDNVTVDPVINIKCRYRPNGSKVVKNAEGQSIVFSGTCYMAKGQGLMLSNGDMVSVPGFIDKQTPILQIYRAQARTRIILQ